MSRKHKTSITREIIIGKFWSIIDSGLYNQLNPLASQMHARCPEASSYRTWIFAVELISSNVYIKNHIIYHLATYSIIFKCTHQGDWMCNLEHHDHANLHDLIFIILLRSMQNLAI